jgi:hypothetical protein
MATTTLEIIGKDSGATAAVKGVNAALADSGVAADQANIHFHGLKGSSDGLFGSLKDLRGEARQHDRVFNFYGAQLASLTGVTKNFGAEIAGLGIALGSGMWVVAAVEGIKMIVSHFQETGKEAKKAAEEAEKEWKKRMDGIQSAIDGVKRKILELKGLDPERVSMGAGLRALNEEMAKLLKEDPEGLQHERMDKLKRDYAELLEKANKYREAREKEASTAFVEGAGKRAQEAAIEAANMEADLEKENAARWKSDTDREMAAIRARLALENHEAAQQNEAVIALQNLERKLDEEKTKAAEKAAALQKKLFQEETAAIEHYLSPMKHAADTALNGLLTGSLNAKQVWDDLWKGMVRTAVNGIVEIGEKWVVTQLTKKLLGSATNMGEVGSEAAVAGAAAYASTAAIPIVGPALAPAAAAEAYGAVISMAPLAAFDVGTWNVPADMVAKIHEGEGVITKPLMDSVRSGEATLGAGRGRGATFNLNVAAWDMHGFERVVTNNDSDFSRALRKMQRRLG